MELLFSYGTLQDEPVQLATFGRKLATVTDTLSGYTLTMLAIKDLEVVKTSGKSHHPIIRHTGNPLDKVTGSLLEITSDELAHSDQYEVDDYKRVSVTLKSTNMAWVYVDANQ